MGVRLGRPSETDLTPLLARARADVITYAPVGISLGGGEESFLVVRDETGAVRFDVQGVSRPTQPIARLVPPIADRLQDSAVRRYLSAMERAVARAD